ncbi:MAG: GNAT family N-acetyltransferase [Phycisphaerae bacterium]|nr:GNAT family N-acetyltransferase [Phycisphaerae bacterium]
MSENFTVVNSKPELVEELEAIQRASFPSLAEDEIIWLSNHNPKGDWLYGADIGVLPAYRRRGIGRMLYEARQGLIRRLNLKGHVAGGMLKGYGPYKNQMSAEEYMEKLKTGEIFDPTVSVQLKGSGCG